MFKKILFGMALLASFAACTDDYTDWADPQSTAQSDAVTFGDGSVSAVSLIDFADIADDQTSVKVCNLQAPSASDDGYTASYKIHLGNNTYDLDANGNMSVADLKDYIESTYGKAPTERDITASVEMWLSNGTTAVKTATSSTFTVKALLVAPFISESYYVVGGALDWAASAASKEQKFTHSDQNVYDDPEFTIVIDAASSGETWFAIGGIEACNAVVNGDWTQLLGTTAGNGNNGLTGTMAPRTELSDDGSFCVKGEYAKIRITINMMEYTYTIEPLNFSEYYYEIGGESGWSTSNVLYGGNFDGTYQGYYYLDSEFKFKPNAGDWNNDLEWISDGNLSANGTSNVPAPEAGFYQINLDVASLTYNLVKVENISIIGSFNGWTGDVDMTYNKAEGCWEGTATVDTNGFKFRLNHDWAISWGGKSSGTDYDNLTYNGGQNLTVPENGTYNFKFYLSYEGANRVVITKQ